MFTFSVRAQDNYEIIKKIGRGKYSEVYEGINTLTNQRIVIKILKPGKLALFTYSRLYSQEKQDSQGNQNSADSPERCEHCRVD